MKTWGPASVVVCALLAAGCGSSGTHTVTVTSTSTPVTSGPPITTDSGTAGGSTATTAPTTTTTSASSTTSAAAPVVHVATFKSPSGNIGCMIIAGTARCDLKQKSWSLPPRPSQCPPIVDFGQGMIVTASGPGRLVCAGDTTLDPSALVVPYGTDTVVSSFRCASRTDGMTCTDAATGHGFFVSIQNYRGF